MHSFPRPRSHTSSHSPSSSDQSEQSATPSTQMNRLSLIHDETDEQLSTATKNKLAVEIRPKTTVKDSQEEEEKRKRFLQGVQYRLLQSPSAGSTTTTSGQAPKHDGNYYNELYPTKYNQGAQSKQALLRLHKHMHRKYQCVPYPVRFDELNLNKTNKNPLSKTLVRPKPLPDEMYIPSVPVEPRDSRETKYKIQSMTCAIDSVDETLRRFLLRMAIIIYNTIRINLLYHHMKLIRFDLLAGLEGFETCSLVSPPQPTLQDAQQAFMAKTQEQYIQALLPVLFKKTRDINVDQMRSVNAGIDINQCAKSIKNCFSIWCSGYGEADARDYTCYFVAPRLLFMEQKDVIITFENSVLKLFNAMDETPISTYVAIVNASQSDPVRNILATIKKYLLDKSSSSSPPIEFIMQSDKHYILQINKIPGFPTMRRMPHLGPALADVSRLNCISKHDPSLNYVDAEVGDVIEMIDYPHPGSVRIVYRRIVDNIGQAQGLSEEVGSLLDVEKKEAENLSSRAAAESHAESKRQAARDVVETEDRY